MEKMTLEEYIDKQIEKCARYPNEYTAGVINALLRVKIFIKSDNYLENQKVKNLEDFVDRVINHAYMYQSEFYKEGVELLNNKDNGEKPDKKETI